MRAGNGGNPVETDLTKDKTMIEARDRLTNQAVHIVDASERRQYDCLHCGEPMIPKSGFLRWFWYFKHEKFNFRCPEPPNKRYDRFSRCLVRLQNDPEYRRWLICDPDYIPNQEKFENKALMTLNEAIAQAVALGGTRWITHECSGHESLSSQKQYRLHKLGYMFYGGWKVENGRATRLEYDTKEGTFVKRESITPTSSDVARAREHIKQEINAKQERDARAMQERVARTKQESMTLNGAIIQAVALGGTQWISPNARHGYVLGDQFARDVDDEICRLGGTVRA